MKTLKMTSLAGFLALTVMNTAIARDAEFKLPEISRVLQTQIDRKLEVSLQQALQAPLTQYAAKPQEKTRKAS